MCFLMNIIERGNSNTTSVIMPIKKVLKIDSNMSVLWLVFKSVIVSSLLLCCLPHSVHLGYKTFSSGISLS